MKDIQKFRKAVNGFNRHDVVTYIEYLNTKHHNEIVQLQNRLQTATRPIANPTLEQDYTDLKLKYADEEQKTAALIAENENLKNEIAVLRHAATALREKIAELQNQPAAPATPSFTDQELEAYRRAERTERMATERARQIGQQAQGVLADVTAKFQASADQLHTAAQAIAAQLDAYKDTVLNSGNILTEAADTLSAICPEE